MRKIIPILFIIFGEALAIYSEVIAAKNVNNFLPTFLKMSCIMMIAGIFLILGYMLGIKYFDDIWIIGVISITSIIIAEPIITYLIFSELPSKGAIIGLILGVLGLLAALFIK
jgi:hypothetical protein